NRVNVAFLMDDYTPYLSGSCCGIELFIPNGFQVAILLKFSEYNHELMSCEYHADFTLLF
ncbi:MAG: hypothetical protein ACPGEF_06955, partial [Endozoicomonas sp.]